MAHAAVAKFYEGERRSRERLLVRGGPTQGAGRSTWAHLYADLLERNAGPLCRRAARRETIARKVSSVPTWAGAPGSNLVALGARRDATPARHKQIWMFARPFRDERHRLHHAAARRAGFGGEHQPPLVADGRLRQGADGEHEFDEIMFIGVSRRCSPKRVAPFRPASISRPCHKPPCRRQSATAFATAAGWRGGCLVRARARTGAQR